jgi:hypothetical protein
MHTCDEMRAVLKKMGVKGTSTMKKAELTKTCKAHGCMDEHGVMHHSVHHRFVPPSHKKKMMK